MFKATHRNNRGFSLIELVIVVVIIGIIAAIAIPRMSRGAEGAREGAVRANLSVLRNALELYRAEHNDAWPPFIGLVDHLTGYSTEDTTAAQQTKDTAAIPPIFLGPYIKAIPALPVGTNKGSAAFADGDSAVLGAGAEGWWYKASTGELRANLLAADADSAGVAYNTY